MTRVQAFGRIGRAPAGMLARPEREGVARFQGEREAVDETIDEGGARRNRFARSGVQPIL